MAFDAKRNTMSERYVIGLTETHLFLLTRPVGKGQKQYHHDIDNGNDHQEPKRSRITCFLEDSPEGPHDE